MPIKVPSFLKWKINENIEKSQSLWFSFTWLSIISQFWLAVMSKFSNIWRINFFSSRMLLQQRIRCFHETHSMMHLFTVHGFLSNWNSWFTHLTIIIFFTLQMKLFPYQIKKITRKKIQEWEVWENSSIFMHQLLFHQYFTDKNSELSTFQLHSPPICWLVPG